MFQEGESQPIDKTLEKEQNIPKEAPIKEEVPQESEAREPESELSAEEREQVEREIFNLENQIKPEVQMLWNRKESEMKLGFFGRLARKKAAYIAASFLALYAARAESQQLPPSVWGRDTVVYEPSGRPSSNVGRSSGGLFESGDAIACGAGGVGTIINALTGQRNPARPIEECIRASVRNRQTYERTRQVVVRTEARRLEQERRSQEREYREETRAASRTGTYIPRRGGSVQTQEIPGGARSTVEPEIRVSRFEQEERSRGGEYAIEDYFETGNPRDLSPFSQYFQTAYRDKWNDLETRKGRTGRTL